MEANDFFLVVLVEASGHGGEKGIAALDDSKGILFISVPVMIKQTFRIVSLKFTNVMTVS